jgi:hypothetical protein
VAILRNWVPQLLSEPSNFSDTRGFNSTSTGQSIKMKKFKGHLSRILKPHTEAKTEPTAATACSAVTAVQQRGDCTQRHIGEWMPTSANICDMCSRINIESLLSPDGYSHVSKKLASTSCPLCKEIFNFREKENENIPVRIKLSQRTSSMGCVTWYLNAELGTQCIRSCAPVITQEG